MNNSETDISWQNAVDSIAQNKSWITTELLLKCKMIKKPFSLEEFSEFIKYFYQMGKLSPICNYLNTFELTPEQKEILDNDWNIINILIKSNISSQSISSSDFQNLVKNRNEILVAETLENWATQELSDEQLLICEKSGADKVLYNYLTHHPNVKYEFTQNNLYWVMYERYPKLRQQFIPSQKVEFLLFAPINRKLLSEYSGNQKFVYAENEELFLNSIIAPPERVERYVKKYQKNVPLGTKISLYDRSKGKICLLNKEEELKYCILPEYLRTGKPLPPEYIRPAIENSKGSDKICRRLLDPKGERENMIFPMEFSLAEKQLYAYCCPYETYLMNKQNFRDNINIWCNRSSEIDRTNLPCNWKNQIIDYFELLKTRKLLGK